MPRRTLGVGFFGSISFMGERHRGAPMVTAMMMSIGVLVVVVMVQFDGNVYTRLYH